MKDKHGHVVISTVCRKCNSKPLYCKEKLHVGQAAGESPIYYDLEEFSDGRMVEPQLMHECVQVVA